MQRWEGWSYQGRPWLDTGSICYLDCGGIMDRHMLKFTKQHTLGMHSLFVSYTTIPRGGGQRRLCTCLSLDLLFLCPATL